MTPKPKKKKPKSVEVEIDSTMQHYTIVGIQYRLTQEARALLARHVPFTVAFMRDKKNEYDENAIAVFIAQDQTMAGQHIGFLRKEVAAVIAPAWDRGDAFPVYGIVDSLNVKEGTAEMKMALSKRKIAS